MPSDLGVVTMSQLVGGAVNDRPLTWAFAGQSPRPVRNSPKSSSTATLVPSSSEGRRWP